MMLFVVCAIILCVASADPVGWSSYFAVGPQWGYQHDHGGQMPFMNQTMLHYTSPEVPDYGLQDFIDWEAWPIFYDMDGFVSEIYSDEVYIKVANIQVVQIMNGTRPNRTGEWALIDGTFNVHGLTGQNLTWSDINVLPATQYYMSGCRLRVTASPNVTSNIIDCHRHEYGLALNYPGPVFPMYTWEFNLPGQSIYGKQFQPQGQCSAAVDCATNQFFPYDFFPWSDDVVPNVTIAWPPIAPNITNVTFVCDAHPEPDHTLITFQRGGNAPTGQTGSHVHWHGPGTTNGWWDKNYTVFWSDNNSTWPEGQSVTVAALDSIEYPLAYSQTVKVPKELMGRFYWSIVATNVFQRSARTIFSMDTLYPLQ